MRARFTQYSVPGWGVGDLWIGEGVLLTHEFRFGPVVEPSANGSWTRGRSGSGARPPMGVHGSPAGTVPAEGSRVGGVFASSSQQLPREPGAAAGQPGAAPGLDPSELADRFTAFLAGRDVTFDEVPIDLEWATPFQRAIATAVRALPRGEVASYGELAALAGYPGAARAVGTFCAQNRFMFVLPCHRIVGATGIGGYGSAGADTKRRLLALEGVTL